MFVEGTRAKPGELLPFRRILHGAQAGVPVVPVAIKNSDVLMGKGTGVARAGTLEMVMMSPVEMLNITTDDDMNRLVTEVRARIAVELKTE